MPNNIGAEVASLIHTEAPSFVKIELHESVDTDGMHSMIEKDEIVIPAQGQTLLASGSLHHADRPKKRLVMGEALPLNLTFSHEVFIELGAMICRRDQMN